jgi:SAM-dependent methyltransferase
MEGPFSAAHFARLDETPDSQFYSFPRKVVHIDEAAIATVKQVFREVLPASGVVLDLLSSWRSHWPEGFPKQRLIGLGLNAEEMADNPDLDEYVVHDVNANPCLPFVSGMFDAVLLTVSIQYLTQPVAVFRDVHRLLKPAAPFVVVFSNRMFPTKAVAIWRMLNDQQHFNLIASYFRQAGNYVGLEARDYTPAAIAYTDPVYVVMARQGGPEPLSQE